MARHHTPKTYHATNTFMTEVNGGVREVFVTAPDCYSEQAKVTHVRKSWFTSVGDLALELRCRGKSAVLVIELNDSSAKLLLWAAMNTGRILINAHWLSDGFARFGYRAVPMLTRDRLAVELEPIALGHALAA